MTRQRIGLSLVLVAIAIGMALGPVGNAGAASHGDQPDPTKGPCETNPAFNETSPRGVPADARGEDAAHVEIPDFEPFDPATLVIDAGTCVEWRNTGSFEHTVTIVANNHAPIVGETIDTLAPGQITNHTFEKPGTYYLHCEINPFHSATMHQVVRVE